MDAAQPLPDDSQVITDPRMVRKQAVDRLMKQIEAEQNPYHGMAAAFGGGYYQHHKLIDVILVLLDPDARAMLEERLELTFGKDAAR